MEAIAKMFLFQDMFEYNHLARIEEWTGTTRI